MPSGRQESKSRNKRRWLKWILVPLLVLGFLAGALYAALFIRVVPPRSVRIVDALTGRPLAGMNVCMQAVSTGWTKQALESDLHATDENGKVFFAPSILNLALLQSFDGYSMHVWDSEGDGVQSCGPGVGLAQDLYPNQFPDEFADAVTDGSQHFPLELVPKEALPKNIGWFPFLRGAVFRSSASVPLIPILDGPDKCRPISDADLLQQCVRLNTLAQKALLQSLAPMYFAGMRRATVHTDVLLSKSHFYTFVYESPTVPPRYMAVTIERFPKGQSAQEHLTEVSRIMPSYDPKNVTEEEPLPGERIKRILSPQTPSAFWASGNQLILITFLTPTSLDQSMTIEWLRLHPASAKS